MKGELFSSDFLISILIFLSVMTIVILYYQNMKTDVYETTVRNDMFSRAVGIANVLATTSGSPQYWESTDVSVIGLYDAGKFNLTKMEELQKMDYQNVRAMLGSGAYNIFIVFRNETGDVMERSGTQYSFGNSYENAEQIVSIKRLGAVRVDGSVKKAVLEVVLWL